MAAPAEHFLETVLGQADRIRRKDKKSILIVIVWK
jgi:hypothetical protein